MKFLIIRFSSIGDIVLTSPVMRCLKRQVLSSEIHYLTRQSFREIVASNPYIDKCHLLGDDLDLLIKELVAEDFDYVIDLHHNIRTYKVKRALGKKAFSFNKLNIEKWMMTALKVNRLPDTHIVNRYLQTVAEFGIRDDGLGLDYFIPDKDRVETRDIPTSHHAGYLGFVIGAALATKQFPLHKWMQVCKEIDHPIVILGGKEDAANGEVLSALDPHKIYNSCGKFSLNESADLVRGAKLVVSNDTGLMHIATAFNRPVISLWGNTIPAFGMYPYYGAVFTSDMHKRHGVRPFDIVEVNNLPCRPCSKIGYRKCPKGHFKCMEDISVNEVLAAIRRRL
ncbi:MAG: glycosyltransferase family 9 protein [Chitinophagaceae bacterium]